MQPWKLIKRVKEIEQEAYVEQETVQQKDAKQTAAVDLSKRLKDFRAINDAASLKDIISLGGMAEKEDGTSQTTRTRKEWNRDLSSLMTLCSEWLMPSCKYHMKLSPYVYV
ncbi:conserved hypothetical protein [Ricinus communis]|uniref:Uncharacterized protein n=1 Tax=Ricinus communis TaxID=3988 RepID=B9SQR4_RICCO|nr:conserved hypothetical protein [Ricinus communis]